MISIIIPAYNCENSLSRCIDSILAQTYSNLEIIIVNDGSTDATLDLCKSYDDKRIVVINKPNGGVSSARNAGLAKATGEFVQFVDGDDAIDETMCEKLMAAINDADVVICGYNIIDGNNARPMVPQASRGEIHGIDEKIYGLFSQWFINSPCNKLYRRKHITKGFNDRLSLGEDLLFNLAYFDGIATFASVDETLYNYIRENGSSLSKRRGIEFIESAGTVYKASMDFYNKYCSSSTTKEDIVSIYVDSLIDFVGANAKDKVLVSKILAAPATKDAFMSYNPHSAMQRSFKEMVLKEKTATVCGFVRMRKLLKR